MSIIARLATVRGQLLWRSLQPSLEHPEEAQLALLRRFLGANRETDFGRRHGFARMSTVADYRSGVPIGDYEAFRPWVDRMAQGEHGVLTAEEPYMFAVTSGTTGQPKLVPVTPSARRAVSRLTAMWIYHCLLGHAKALDRKALVIVSPSVDGYTDGGIPFGSASGYIYQHASWAIRRTYALPYALFSVADYEAKYYSIMRFSIQRDVSFVITPNPSTIVKLLAVADQRREELIRDVRDGTLSRQVEIEPALRAVLQARLRPDAARAAALERIVHETGFLDPRAYWPYLALVGCWRGGSVGVALDRLRAWLRPDAPFRDIGFLASEAQMTVPISDEGAGGVLAVDTNFYEFVPEDEMGTAEPRVLTAGQLEEGDCYYILLTTPSGLYRYDINDVVRVRGFHGRTPIIEFARKGRDMVSLTGEKLHVGQIIEAVTEARRATGIDVEHFRAIGNAEESRYDLRLELGGADPLDEALAAFGRAVDEHLARLNIEYDQKRRSGRLGPLRVQVMPQGWHARRREAKLARGGRDVQFKDALLGLPDADDNVSMVAREIEG